MARQVQLIRGTTEQNDAFTGATGAMTYDTDTKGLRVHDGSTQGGFEVPTAAMADYVIYWDSADATDHSHAKPGVSTPTDHGWYRYYKSGWVEQGGSFSGNAPLSIALPIIMANTGYSCLSAHGRRNGINWNGNPVTLTAASTTTLGVNVYGEYQNMTGWWEVKGYAA